MRQLIEPDEARQLIDANLPKTGTERRPIDQCAGAILRESIETDRPFPPFDRVMMDGFALRAAESSPGAVFKVTAQAPAGSPQVNLDLESMSAVEVMTGAILPKGADCVVPYEDTEALGGGQIKIVDPTPIQSGDFVHRLGSDFPEGHRLLEAGRRLGGREIAAAATCGWSDLLISTSPKIAISCSGDELVEVSAKPLTHQIRRSNDYSVEAALHSVGLNQTTRHHLPDEVTAMRSAIADLVSGNDVIILCGGVSMGKKDLIPSVLKELGLTCHFHGIAQKPGKPMGFWTGNGRVVFALPGNPLSTLTCLHHYALPAILDSMGLERIEAPREIQLTASSKVRKDFTVFLPVSLLENNQADPSPAQNSGDLARILHSDGYIAVPAGDAEAKKGATYLFHPWH